MAKAKTESRHNSEKESNQINDGKPFLSIRQLFEFRELNQKVW